MSCLPNCSAMPLLHIELADSNEYSQSLLSHCRICLASHSTKMFHLFNEQSLNQSHSSLLNKLNFCSCFTNDASINDNLPQYICMSCSILVENAYQLKVLCTKTEQKIMKLQQKRHDNNEETEQCESETESRIVINCAENEFNASDHADLELNYVIEHDTNMQLEGLKNRNCHDDVENDLEQEVNEFPTNSDNMKKQEQLVDKTKTTKSHTDDAEWKPNQCEYCKKRFRLKHSLIVHLRSHTGERPYACEVCGKKFKTTSALSLHRVVHIDERNFKCTLCDYVTKTKANLNVHLRLHSTVAQYECKLCSKKFKTQSNMMKHMRNIHEKQKPHTCNKCGRSYFSGNSLRKHSIVHTGLKPYDCPVKDCPTSFGWYNGLKKHFHHQHRDENITLPSEKFYFDEIKKNFNL